MANEELFSDELLSAYLDGELTDQERTLVEQRLESDAEARQLLSELQDLSTTIRALPQEKVGSDLRAKVLEGHKKEVQQTSNASRRWIWPMAALAAALLLSIYLPNDEPVENMQVAQKADAPVSGPKRIALQPDSSRELEEEMDFEPEAALADESLPGGKTFQQDFVANERAQTLEAVRAEAATTEEESKVYRIHLTLNEPETFRRLLAEKGLGQQPRGMFRAMQPPGSRQEIRVKAVPKDIEEVLKACHLDKDSLRSLRLDEQVKENKQLASWMKWERIEKGGRKQDCQQGPCGSTREHSSRI